MSINRIKQLATSEFQQQTLGSTVPVEALATCHMKGKVNLSLIRSPHHGNISLCLIKHYTLKTYWGVEIQLHTFLTLALEGNSCIPCLLYSQGKSPPALTG